MKHAINCAVVTSISLEKELHAAIKLIAAQGGRSTNRQIQLMLAAAMRAHEAGIDLAADSWAARHKRPTYSKPTTG